MVSFSEGVPRSVAIIVAVLVIVPTILSCATEDVVIRLRVSMLLHQHRNNIRPPNLNDEEAKHQAKQKEIRWIGESEEAQSCFQSNLEKVSANSATVFSASPKAFLAEVSGRKAVCIAGQFRT